MAAPNVSVNGLGSFKTTRGSNSLVFLDSDGNLFAENPFPGESVNGDFVDGIGEIIRLENASAHIPAGSFMDTTTGYGRLFMAYGDLKRTGSDGPRQFYYDTTTGRFHYNGIGLQSSATPVTTVESSILAGDIEAGTRYVLVLFKTRTGYISGWTTAAIKTVTIATANKKITLTGIPVSPDPNVVARIVAFTQAGVSSEGPYFYIPSDDFIQGLNATVDSNGNNITATVIADNTTTSATFTFPDEYLIASSDVTDFLDKFPLDTLHTSIYFSKTLRRLIVAGEDDDTYRLSEVDDPETFFATTGLNRPGQGDGGRAVTAREYRGELYFLKTNGGHLVVDSTLTPAEWKVIQRWERVGPEGPWAVDVNDEFMAFAHRSGPYIYVGTQPIWIGYEISGNLKNFPVWEKINWEQAHKIYVTIDSDNKLVKFGVPMEQSTKVNMEFICDYSLGWSKRRWSYDDVSTTRAIAVQRPQDDISSITLGYDGRIKTAQILHASNADDGNIYFEDPNNHTLNGQSFEQSAQLAYTPYQNVPGIYRLGAVDVVAAGQGNASVIIRGDNKKGPDVKMDLALEGDAKDFDRKATGQHERWSIEISNKGELNGWWELQRVVLWINLIWQTRSV